MPTPGHLAGMVSRLAFAMDAAAIASAPSATRCALGQSRRCPAFATSQASRLPAAALRRSFSSPAHPVRPELVTFQARVGLDVPAEVMVAVLPVKSSIQSSQSDHERYKVLGAHFVNFLAARHLLSKYPQLPANQLESAVEAFVGAPAMASVGRSLGVEKLISWLPYGDNSRTKENMAISRTVYAIVGAALATQGSQAARVFVERFMLSRKLDFGLLMKRVAEPKRVLAASLKLRKMEAPVSRILEESGRRTHAPVFVVGIYSGQAKLGEGVGSSLHMAETRAARAALQSIYAKEDFNSGLLERDLEGLPEAKLSFFEQR